MNKHTTLSRGFLKIISNSAVGAPWFERRGYGMVLL
jgi:hypothetical protein